MWTHEPAPRLSSMLLERFGSRASTDEFRRLSHDRLMEESQRRLANAVLSGQPNEERVATRILDNARDYRRWEDEHATLMRRIAAERLPSVQKAQLLEHCAFADPSQGTVRIPARRAGSRDRREEIMAHFFAHRDYKSAVVAEHGRYLRSAASYLCSSHVGSNVMFDALFEIPLAEYEELYASYFRTYCSTVLASDDNAVAKSMLAVLVDLKAQIGEWRKALIALTHSQSGIWRRPVI